MRHLLAKDVRLVAPYLWVIVPAHVLWCVQAFLFAHLYFWMSLAAALGWTVAVVMIEWHAEADRLVASLPVTRAAIVGARYASALGGVALGAALYLLYGYAVTAVASEGVLRRWPAEPAWASVGGVLTFAAVGYALVIGFLPFFFRFGLTLGTTLFSVSTGAVLVAAIGIARLAGASWYLAGTVWGAWPAPLGVVAIAAVLAVLGVLSIRLSIRFYEGRDL